MTQFFLNIQGLFQVRSFQRSRKRLLAFGTLIILLREQTMKLIRPFKVWATLTRPFSLGLAIYFLSSLAMG